MTANSPISYSHRLCEFIDSIFWFIYTYVLALFLEIRLEYINSKLSSSDESSQSSVIHFVCFLVLFATLQKEFTAVAKYTRRLLGLYSIEKFASYEGFWSIEGLICDVLYVQISCVVTFCVKSTISSLRGVCW